MVILAKLTPKCTVGGKWANAKSWNGIHGGALPRCEDKGRVTEEKREKGKERRRRIWEERKQRDGGAQVTPSM